MPKQIICARCGNPLRATDAFCTSCGAPAGPPSQTPSEQSTRPDAYPSDSAAALPMDAHSTAKAFPSAFGNERNTAPMPVSRPKTYRASTQGRPADGPIEHGNNLAAASETTPFDATSPGTSSPCPSSTGTSSDEGRPHGDAVNKALLMGCIIGGVGIIALTLVLLFTVGPFAHSAEDATQSESALTENSAQGDSAHEGDNGEGQGNGASKQGGTEGDTADNALDGALDDKPKAGTDISQQENVVYDTLTEAYADLGELDADIKESAARFNADHLNPNALLRAEEADAAYELLQEAQELKREFGLLHVPENSVNKTQAELIGNCIDDCIERIRVICNAWDVSLSFADPNDHEEDILAPIQDANDSGRSIPLEDFNEKYPQARPVKP